MSRSAPVSAVDNFLNIVCKHLDFIILIWGRKLNFFFYQKLALEILIVNVIPYLFTYTGIYESIFRSTLLCKFSLL